MRWTIFFFALTTLMAQRIALNGDFGLVKRDPAGNWYVVEATGRAGLVTTEGAVQAGLSPGQCISGGRVPFVRPCEDLYIRKFAPDGTTLLAATYLGGTKDESAQIVSVDGDRLAIAMYSLSEDLAGGFSGAGQNQTMVAVLSADLQRLDGLRRLSRQTLSDVALVPGGVAVAVPTFVAKLTGSDLHEEWRSWHDATAQSPIATLDGGDLLVGSPQSLRRLNGATGEVRFQSTVRAATHVFGLLVDGERVWIYGSNQDEFFGRGFVAGYDLNGAEAREPDFLGQGVERVGIVGGKLVVMGSSARGLDATRGAAFPCYDDGLPEFFAVYTRDGRSRELVSYIGWGISSRLAGIEQGRVLRADIGAIFAVDLPPMTDSRNPICLEKHAESFAQTDGFGSQGLGSYARTNAAPGDMLTFFGAGVAGEPVRFEPEKTGSIPKDYRGMRVLIDGEPAGILSVGPQRVSVAFPYSIAGKDSVGVVMEVAGLRSNEVRMRVAGIAPVYLSRQLDSTGYLYGVYRGSELLTAENPAYVGDEVTIYLTGGGELERALDPSTITKTGEPLRLRTTVTARMLDSAAEVTYAGVVGGQLPGLTQINIKVPVNPATPAWTALALDFGGSFILIPVPVGQR